MGFLRIKIDQFLTLRLRFRAPKASRFGGESIIALKCDPTNMCCRGVSNIGTGVSHKVHIGVHVVELLSNIIDWIFTAAKAKGNLISLECSFCSRLCPTCDLTASPWLTNLQVAVRMKHLQHGDARKCLEENVMGHHSSYAKLLPSPAYQFFRIEAAEKRAAEARSNVPGTSSPFLLSQGVKTCQDFPGMLIFEPLDEQHLRLEPWMIGGASKNPESNYEPKWFMIDAKPSQKRLRAKTVHGALFFVRIIPFLDLQGDFVQLAEKFWMALKSKDARQHFYIGLSPM